MVVGNRSGYHNAKSMDMGEKAEKIVLSGGAAFLLTINATILPGGEKSSHLTRGTRIQG